MKCQICGPDEDRAERHTSTYVGRTRKGYPITCHQLECGHRSHVPLMTSCDCADKVVSVSRASTDKSLDSRLKEAK